MPELPEVETIARGLASRVTGDVIESVWLGSKPEPLKSPAAEIVATLESRRIAGVRRVGKHIVFDLEPAGDVGRAPSPAKGRNRARSSSSRKKAAGKSARPTQTNRAVDRPPGDDRAHGGLPAGRRNGKTHTPGRKAGVGQGIALRRSAALRALECGPRFRSRPVPEPLEVQLDHFVSLFHGRKTPIKSALLNQKLLRGVGNIYADESLFRAGIRPRRRASSLTREDLRRLYPAVQEVLREAIALGGSSVSDYVDADGEEGFFQLQHRVYGREGEPCLVCKTPIKRVVIAGRSSHYCPKCQK